MAVIAPLAGELVLDAAEGLGAGNLVQGAETVASQFKTQILQYTKHTKRLFYKLSRCQR